MPPTYEYRCERGHEFEVEQRITEEPLVKCSIRLACTDSWAGPGSSLPCERPVKRLIPRGTSFRLEGGGWAKEGYGS